MVTLVNQLDKINSLVLQLDEQTQAALKGISRTKAYKKGELLLRQGDISRESFWIEKGILRKYIPNDGKELTTELLFENDLAVSFTSYTLQTRSEESIQALTDVTVSQTDALAFREAKVKFPKLIELDLLLIEYHALWLEKRLLEFHTLDASQRYLRLIQEQPEIIQRISLTHIASFLGISLETLSRIRSKI